MDPIWNKESFWSIKGRLFPLHLVSMRETLLPKAQLRRVHLYYLEWIWSHCCPPHLTGSLKWRKTSHDTRNDPPHTHGTCIKAGKGQAWLLQCRWGLGAHGALRGHPATLESCLCKPGHTWGLWMLRGCSQPMGSDNQRSQEGRQRHPPGLPRRSSFCDTR